MPYADATTDEINIAVRHSLAAFHHYKKLDLKSRSAFLHAIAKEMEDNSSSLIAIANRETHLDEARLQVELKRTLFQLTSYGDACAEGSWLDIRIDTQDQKRNPPKPDLRKMLFPLGYLVLLIFLLRIQPPAAILPVHWLPVARL